MERLGLKLAYDGSWRGARIHVEADSVSELANAILELGKSGEVGLEESPKDEGSAGSIGEYPQILGHIGCASGLRVILASEWGRMEGRTESEISNAFRANALHFPHGTISGLLTSLTRRGELRRIGKKGGSYAYVI